MHPLRLAKGVSPMAALVLTAATYSSFLWAARPWFGFTIEWLTIMMQIEILVIHSFAFLMLIAWFQPKTIALKSFAGSASWPSPRCISSPLSNPKGVGRPWPPSWG